MTFVKNGVTNDYSFSGRKRRDTYVCNDSVPIQSWQWIQAKAVHATSDKCQNLTVPVDPG